MTTTRATVAGIALAALAALALADLAASGGADIYDQPPLLALGSGQAAGGGHCAALPN